MGLTLKDTGSIMLESNKVAAKAATSIVAGNVINDRLVKLVKPQLPIYARSYLETKLGQALVANAAAAAIINIMPTNEKAVLAAEAMINAAMLNFTLSFNIQDKINELLDGISMDMLRTESETEEGGE